MGASRAVFRADDGTYTVLCGDGKAIDGAFCTRFRMRFRTNVMEAFDVGFVHSEADAMDLDEELGLGANSEHSVGICCTILSYAKETFELFDKENYGKQLPSHLPS